MTLTLPYPPTVNTYWRRVGNKTILSAKARSYRANVIACAIEQGAPRITNQRLRVQLDVHPPDHRRRDLDNLPKALLDALQHARVIDDDGHIDQLAVNRRDVISGGLVIVTVSVLP